MLMTKKSVREAAGISNDFPMCLSIVVACDTDIVVIWAYTVQNNIVVAQIGSIRITIFTSSTSVTVARRHLSTLTIASYDTSASLIAALSRKLPKIERAINNQNNMLKIKVD
ncbi:hypothetical protein Hanom_Chr13g01220541 [Helianthus anomalus]